MFYEIQFQPTTGGVCVLTAHDAESARHVVAALRSVGATLSVWTCGIDVTKNF